MHSLFSQGSESDHLHEVEATLERIFVTVTKSA